MQEALHNAIINRFCQLISSQNIYFLLPRICIQLREGSCAHHNADYRFACIKGKVERSSLDEFTKPRMNRWVEIFRKNGLNHLLTSSQIGQRRK